MTFELENQYESSMIFSGIVSVARNGVIGINNRLPVRLPADLRRFRVMTNKHPIIMGRKTHQAIGKSLPDRTNIVLSRNAAFIGYGDAIVTSRMEYACELAQKTKAKSAYVIGGRQIFDLFLPLMKRLYLTVIHADLEGDTYFPIPVDTMLKWEGRKVQDFPESVNNKYKHTFHILDFPEIEEVATHMETSMYEGL